ncbi:MAG: hypothetical protein QXH03_01435 [Candidatus Bathyarchaeia archaeon]
MRAIRISFKPLRIQVEREEVYTRLKRLLDKAEFLANNHESVKVRLRAMEIVVKIAQFLAGTLKDIQLDEIQSEIERLEQGD